MGVIFSSVGPIYFAGAHSSNARPNFVEMWRPCKRLYASPGLVSFFSPKIKLIFWLFILLHEKLNSRHDAKWNGRPFYLLVF